MLAFCRISHVFAEVFDLVGSVVDFIANFSERRIKGTLPTGPADRSNTGQVAELFRDCFVNGVIVGGIGVEHSLDRIA